MKLKKALLVTGAASTIGLSSLAGMGVASAATATNTAGTDGGGTTSLIDKLATKFNLNKDEVKAVFDEDREAHEAERQQKMEERLSQAVKDGKITSAQKTLILDKMKEMHTFMESLKDKSESDRRDAMKTKMDELKQWATDNNISDEYLPMTGHGERGGMMMKVRGDASGFTTKSN